MELIQNRYLQNYLLNYLDPIEDLEICLTNEHLCDCFMDINKILFEELKIIEKERENHWKFFPNEKGKCNDTVNKLFVASRNNCLVLVKYLYYSDKNIKDENLNKLLHNEEHADIDSNVRSIIVASCEKGRCDILKWLEKERTNIVKYFANMGKGNAFVECCRNGHFEMAQWIIGLGLNIVPFLKQLGPMENVFSASVSNGHLEIADWLLELGKVFNLTSLLYYRVHHLMLYNYVGIRVNS